MFKNKFSKIVCAVAAAFILSIILSFFSFEARCEDIRNNVLRLHILANSDNEYDQALKLKVRDEILNSSGELFNQCTDLESAISFSKNSLKDWEIIAENVVRENGYDYDVNVALKRVYFETRHYDTFTLPAGFYEAVQFEIGEGKGKNWWCVMFPSFCLSAAAEKESLKYLGEDATKIITNSKKYEIRFKTVEIYQKIKKFIRNKSK